MSEPHSPNRATPRRARARSKDQRRVPLNLRVTPQMRSILEEVAHATGRSLSQHTEFTLEHALLGEAEAARLAKEREEAGELLPGWPGYRAPQPPSRDLIGRFIRLEADIAGLRAAVEKGLDRNTEVIDRIEARLYRRIAEFEAKVAIDATEVTTAIEHLQTVTAHLLAVLRELDVVRTDRRREAAGAPPRPRLVPAAGGDAK